MNPRAKDRLNADLHRVLSAALVGKVNDPQLRTATILGTQLSADGSVCTVYVTDHLAAFQKAGGFFRSEVARVLNRRRTPKIVFVQDKGQENANRVTELLAQLATQGEKNEI